jgi:hypothetical protein
MPRLGHCLAARGWSELGRNGLLCESARGPRSRSKLAMLRPQSAEWCLDLSRNPQSERRRRDMPKVLKCGDVMPGCATASRE